jgi:N-acetylglucosaminyldiphosphoundecaprenol N-acetyl-beta-D-mannosaminyltransferase
VSAGLPAIDLDGIRVHAVSEAQCVAYVGGELASGRGGWIVTPNLEHLRMLRSGGPLGDCYRAADLVVADGMPLVWASRLQRTPLPGRVAGSDLIWSLSRAAAGSGRSIFLLGGEPGTAAASAARLQTSCPGLRVAGTLCPAPGFEDRPGELDAIVVALVTARPDLVFVGLGAPKQELLIARLRSRLPAAWWVGVGISFSFVAGRVRRAPRWLRRVGLEWLHRLVQEPRRLAGRYLVRGLPHFAALLTRAALRGLRGRRRPPAA